MITASHPGPPATLTEVWILLVQISIPARQWHSLSPLSSAIGSLGNEAEWPQNWRANEVERKVKQVLLPALCLPPNRPRVTAQLLFTTQAEKSWCLKPSLRLQAWTLEQGFSTRNKTVHPWRLGGQWTASRPHCCSHFPKWKHTAKTH